MQINYKNHILPLLCCLLMSFVSCTDRTIDFEVYPDGELTNHLDPIDTNFSDWGIALITSKDDFGNDTPAVIGQYTEPWIKYTSGISSLAPWPNDGTTYYGTAQAPITIYFTTAINYFSVYALDVGYNGLIVNAYDSDENLIDSLSIDGTFRAHNGIPGGDGRDFIEFTVPGIVKITFSQIHSPDWDREHDVGLEGYLLDDIRFIMPSTLKSTSTQLDIPDWHRHYIPDQERYLLDAQRFEFEPFL